MRRIGVALCTNTLGEQHFAKFQAAVPFQDLWIVSGHELPHHQARVPCAPLEIEVRNFEMGVDQHGGVDRSIRPQKIAKRLDRKSTRLNSSHLGISYAVFCLKKKKKIIYYRHA